MSTTLAGKPPKVIVYPESDGKPIAENTLQFRWIMTIQGGLDALFAPDVDVFVAGDLLWYPVEGQPSICAAPDTMVVFNRPRGDRRSYLQWEEGGLAPQVVFEILSPGNRGIEMTRKFQFYERYKVQEYYVYDPDNGELSGWLRKGDSLVEIPQMQGWISPRLKVRFELIEGELALYGPDERRFATYRELIEQRKQAEQEKEQALRSTQQQAEIVEKLRAQLQALGQTPII
jgi:Uma2 family endonuclease